MTEPTHRVQDSLEQREQERQNQQKAQTGQDQVNDMIHDKKLDGPNRPST